MSGADPRIMKSPTTSGAAPAAAARHPNESLRHLPAAARTAYDRFQAGGDPAMLDVVLFAILDDFVPGTPAGPVAALAGSTRLVDDLGFDSLAITEVVFFAEDLFGITISNDEIVQVRTLDDLRGFIRRKVAVRSAR
jgi:acyl carrier protein